MKATYVTPREWYQCLKQGVDAIHFPYRMKGFPVLGIPQIVVWHLPSFTDCKSWAVVDHRKTGALQVVTTVWKQEEDMERMGTLMLDNTTEVSSTPTLVFTLNRLDEKWFNEKYTQLKSIQLPIAVDSPFGLDSETYGLSLPPLQTCFEWWCEGPDEWKELVTWTRDFIAEITEQQSDSLLGGS